MVQPYCWIKRNVSAMAEEIEPAPRSKKPAAWSWLVIAGCWALSVGMGPLVWASQAAPEPASGYIEKTAVERRHQMIVTANPLASQAGYGILKQGGSAVDAAIAAQLVLGLTEPQSSGIGGGAFMLHYDGQQVVAFDGRETAPAAARPERFLTPEGAAMDFDTAVIGGRSVGVPGVLALLEQAHLRYGNRPWADLFQPAIKLAEQGFPISPRLYALLVQQKAARFNPAARHYFFMADGKPKAVGSLIQNPEYAATLRLIAQQGALAFYHGPIAADIVSAVTHHPTNPGDLTIADLAHYRARQHHALCTEYRLRQICAVPPPDSGGVAVLQMLKIMERFPLKDYAPLSVNAVHVFSEAGRLAFADRNQYMADPDFVAVPTQQLLDATYLAQRSQLINLQTSMGQAVAGTPVAVLPPQGSDNAVELPSTSHLVVVDRQGRAVSMTSSIEDAFGSRIMVRGFMLNNQLTDFSFNPKQGGHLVANRVEAGKRPRSAMAPMMVFDHRGQLEVLVGAPGGSSIINYVAQTLLGLLDWQLDAQQAVSLPHYGSRNGATELEVGRGLDALGAPLQARGHAVNYIELNSGLSVIRRTQHGWQGGADPRREGLALGD